MTTATIRPSRTRSPTIPPEWERVDVRLARAFRRGTLPKQLVVAGPAGTGKTYAILRFLHRLCLCNDNLRVLLARATRAALSESVLVTYEQEILPATGHEGLATGVQRRVRQSYRYPGGSEVVLGGLDNPSRILSTAWDVAFVNEGTEATQEAVETLGSRLARPGRDPRLGLLLLDCNPGSPTHWIKKKVDDDKLAMWETRHEANPRLHDGRGWTAEGRAYLAQLDRLTGTRRARLRDGLWAAGEGLWFDAFDPAIHVTADAEFDPALPVHMALDSGVYTGAVWFQVREVPDPIDGRPLPMVNVFGDFLSENWPAERNAQAVAERSVALCGGLPEYRCTDPAGNARNPIGPAVLTLYDRAGLRLNPWPKAKVADGLALIEDLLGTVEGVPRLTVHPRCRWTIGAFANYLRKRQGDQWMDEPEDPCHPWEDLMDSLRGGLYSRFHGSRPLRTSAGAAAEADRP